VNSHAYDWKNHPKRHWPYKGIQDPKYIKERSEFFIANAPEEAPFNGWWMLVNVRILYKPRR